MYLLARKVVSIADKALIGGKDAVWAVSGGVEGVVVVRVAIFAQTVVVACFARSVVSWLLGIEFRQVPRVQRRHYGKAGRLTGKGVIFLFG